MRVSLHSLALVATGDAEATFVSYRSPDASAALRAAELSFDS
jgi:hypothetical protein